MQKVMLNDGAAFADQCTVAFDAPNCAQARLSSTCDGPAYLLAMDELLAAGVEQIRREEGHPAVITSTVLDRDHLSQECLGFVNIPFFIAFLLSVMLCYH